MVLAVEVLACVLVLIVAVAVVPAQTGVYPQLLAVVVVEVGAQHLTGVQSATVPLFLVVGVAQHHEAGIVSEAAARATCGIAFVCSPSHIDVGHVATVHALLDGEVQHRFLVAVLDARDAGLVALLVVELHVLDNRNGYVLQGGLRVAQHEFLSVNQYLLHRLSVDGDISVLVDVGSRHSLDEFLNGGALWGAIRFGII